MATRRELLIIERELDKLDPDSPEWETLNDKANLIASELEVAELAIKRENEIRLAKERAETAAKLLRIREENLRQRISERLGNYDEWFKWAESLYTITDDFTVVSKALNWSEEKVWYFNDRISCLEKIEQLIMYKEYDHFKRQRT